MADTQLADILGPQLGALRSSTDSIRDTAQTENSKIYFMLKDLYAAISKGLNSVSESTDDVDTDVEATNDNMKQVVNETSSMNSLMQQSVSIQNAMVKQLSSIDKNLIILQKDVISSGVGSLLGDGKIGLIAKALSLAAGLYNASGGFAGGKFKENIQEKKLSPEQESMFKKVDAGEKVSADDASAGFLNNLSDQKLADIGLKKTTEDGKTFYAKREPTAQEIKENVATEGKYRPAAIATQRDLDQRVVNTIWREAEHSPQGILALVSTMINRRGGKGYGPDLLSVAAQHGQFVGYDKGRPTREQSEMIRQVVRDAMAGRLPDPTHGANEFRSAPYVFGEGAGGPFARIAAKQGYNQPGGHRDNVFALTNNYRGPESSYETPKKIVVENASPEQLAQSKANIEAQERANRIAYATDTVSPSGTYTPASAHDVREGTIPVKQANTSAFDNVYNMIVNLKPGISKAAAAELSNKYIKENPHGGKPLDKWLSTDKNAENSSKKDVSPIIDFKHDKNSALGSVQPLESKKEPTLKPGVNYSEEVKKKFVPIENKKIEEDKSLAAAKTPESTKSEVTHNTTIHNRAGHALESGGDYVKKFEQLGQYADILSALVPRFSDLIKSPF